MKYKNTLLAVTDMDNSVGFYKNVLGLRVVTDLGANKTLTGGLSLQTRESWAEFLGVSPDELCWCGRVGELYFEEDDFDAFAERLNTMDIRYVHPVKEHSWGQRAVRFYDPDGHIIELGESMKTVVLRFLDQGLSEEEAARRSQFPLEFVRWCQTQR